MTDSYCFEYDSLGRLIRSKQTDGNGILIQRTEHQYDSANRLTSQGWQIGSDGFSESYTYDSDDGSLSGAPEPSITARIHRKSDKLVIWMENTCRPQLDCPNVFPGEKYGVGLLSVQQTVEACEGELSLTAKDGVFTALGLLNLPE